MKGRRILRPNATIQDEIRNDKQASMKGRRILRPNAHGCGPATVRATGFNEGPENSPAKLRMSRQSPAAGESFNEGPENSPAKRRRDVHLVGDPAGASMKGRRILRPNYPLVAEICRRQSLQ